MNLANVIESHDADRIALVDDDDEISFGELRDRVAALRVDLVARGIGTGSVVALVAGNEPHFATASLAVLGLGAIVMPVNPSSTDTEFDEKFAAGRAELTLVGQQGVRVLEHLEQLDVPHVVLDDVPVSTSDESPRIVDRSSDDHAFYMATSGVSGSPKVAILSHGNLDWVQEALENSLDPAGPDDVVLGVLPFVHIFGLNVVLFSSLRVGAKIVLQRRFDPDDSLDLVERHSVTVLTGAPPMWQRWVEADVPDDVMATIRYGASGAAALPLGTFERVRDRFGVEIAQGYGLTETSPVVTLGRGHPIRPSSVGKVLDGVTVALVDAAGEPVDVGDEGEVVVRSPGVFLGYLDDPETTDSVLTHDGWLWTGDVGIFDDEGYLYLVDRIKDLIIVSGFNVYPAEVENALMRYPEVTGAIVTGSPDELTGERVVAHVTGAVTVEELKEFMATQLSKYKLPVEYHVLDDLPIAPTGKVIRRALR